MFQKRLKIPFRPFFGENEISKLFRSFKGHWGTVSINTVAGSFGSLFPEYAYTMLVMAPGIVCSYGIVPAQDPHHTIMPLVKWVQSAASRGEIREQILDTRLSTVSFSWRKEMLAALKVALLCTDTTSAKRPKMKEVVEMLQEIKQT